MFGMFKKVTQVIDSTISATDKILSAEADTVPVPIIPPSPQCWWMLKWSVYTTAREYSFVKKPFDTFEQADAERKNISELLLTAMKTGDLFALDTCAIRGNDIIGFLVSPPEEDLYGKNS